MIIKENLAHRNNYGQKRNMNVDLWLVIHYTANDGDHDESNANYFKQDLKANGRRVASAHVFVDDDSATVSVPYDYIAYSVGGDKYSNIPTPQGGEFYRKCTNTNSISIEMCDTIKNGVVMATEKTIDNTAQLAAFLMKTYKIPMSRLIRHYQVTGKRCPEYFIDEKKWQGFKNKVQKKLDELNKPQNPYGDELPEKKMVMIKDSYLRSTPEVNKNKVSYSELSATLKKKCRKNENGWAIFNDGSTFTRIRSFIDKDGNKWMQLKSKYWVCVIYNGEKMAKEA